MQHKKKILTQVDSLIKQQVKNMLTDYTRLELKNENLLEY